MEEARNRRFEALVNVGAASLAATEADAALRESVVQARDAGATWREVGDALGVTKQTAWEKFWRDCGPTYHTA